ncbi:MAG: hypothetical protein WC942_01120 [Clostridia bacterium]|jgi:hypothetical protein
MDNKQIAEAFLKHSEIIASLAIKYSMLETLLIEKGVLTEEECLHVSKSLTEVFVQKAKEQIEQIENNTNSD